LLQSGDLQQVVAFQAAMEVMAEQFPGAFAGYTLQVTESHQLSEVDTSGTAKAVISSFQKLGLHFKLGPGWFIIFPFYHVFPTSPPLPSFVVVRIASCCI
jgi:hypothetical protein